MRRSEIRIGSAGWSVPARHAAGFPVEGSHLERYAARMPAVEINTSFYRPHQRATYERWAAATPPGFRFAVKVPRLATHDQRLADPDAVLDRFADEVSGLGGRLGALLVQTPPNLKFDAAVAEPFFAAVNDRFTAPVVLEPRHADWFTSEVDGWLAERRIVRVAADPAKHPGADRPGGWDGLAYFRLHGSPRIYYSAYEDDYLRTLADRLTSCARKGPVWCIFDNTAGSEALGDALKAMAQLKGPAGELHSARRVDA